MLIALKIKNFADMNKTFSFAASTKERKFYPHLININQGKFLSVTGFPAISSETDIFFKCLHFLRQITIRTGASLAHENISPYCSLIQNTAEFSVVFRIFGTLYLYNLNLSPHAVTAESLYLCHGFDKKNPFSSQNTDCIFERTQDAYPILNVHKSLHEQIQSTPQNATVLSKFKEKEEHSAYLRSAHTWFRKELFVFEDTKFLDFMSERGIFFEGVNLLEGKRICAAEVQDFLSKDIFAYLTNPEKEFFTVHVGENEIILSKKLPDKNSLNITFSAPSELFRKFITSLHAVKNEKYRVFAVPRITDTLDGFFSYLLLKIFLSDRYECYNQLFFSSKDYRIFSQNLLRADEIHIPQTEQNMPQSKNTEQTAFPQAEQSLQAQIKAKLPPPEVPETQLEDNRKYPLPSWFWIALIGTILLLLTAKYKAPFRGFILLFFSFQVHPKAFWAVPKQFQGAEHPCRSICKLWLLSLCIPHNTGIFCFPCEFPVFSCGHQKPFSVPFRQGSKAVKRQWERKSKSKTRHGNPFPSAQQCFCQYTRQ